MLSIRYGGSIQQIFWACFSSTTVAGMCVVILLLGVDRFEWTREKCVLCVLTSAFYLLLKTLGVLVKIAMYLTRNHISTIQSPDLHLTKFFSKSYPSKCLHYIHIGGVFSGPST